MSAEALKRFRAEVGWTQARLARLFNVDGRTVRRWEAGANIPASVAIALSLSHFRRLVEKEKAEDLKQSTL